MLLCSSVVHLTGLIFVQVETLKVPEVVDQLLEDYAQRYHAVKAPRKLQWRKHLGTVKVFLSLPLLYSSSSASLTRPLASVCGEGRPSDVVRVLLGVVDSGKDFLRSTSVSAYIL